MIWFSIDKITYNQQLNMEFSLTPSGNPFVLISVCNFRQFVQCDRLIDECRQI